MRVLLIQPSDYLWPNISAMYRKHGRFKVTIGARGHSSPVTLPPLGLMYLATPMLKTGYEVAILDAWSLQLTNGEIVEEARLFHPDVIGISFYSDYVRIVYELTTLLKQAFDVPIVVGGPHPSSMSGQVLAEYNSVDCLIKGWGEFSIVRMLSWVGGKGNPEEIPGLWYRHNGTIRGSPVAQLPSNLDDILPPSRGLLQAEYDKGIYRNILSRRRRMDVLLTSRNCPYKCGFCYNLGGHKYYPHGIDRVLEEINEMVERGIDAIEIMDDTFTLSRKRADAILDGIIARRYDLELRIRSRVNLIDEPLIAKCKTAGVRAISYGMESGSDAMLHCMDKQTTVAQNEAACRITKRAGLLCHTTWVMGYPGETPETMEETYHFIKKIRPSTTNISLLAPFPDTRIYNQAKMEKTLVGDWATIGKEAAGLSSNENIRRFIYIRLEAWPDYDSLKKAIDNISLRVLFDWRYLIEIGWYFLRHPNGRFFQYVMLEIAYMLWNRFFPP